MGKDDRTRVIGYAFEGEFDETEMERILQKAELAGIVTQFDTGRGSMVWFNGHPGAELRRVRQECVAIIQNCKPILHE